MDECVNEDERIPERAIEKKAPSAYSEVN